LLNKKEEVKYNKWIIILISKKIKHKIFIEIGDKRINKWDFYKIMKNKWEVLVMGTRIQMEEEEMREVLNVNINLDN
jgi:hypothetical protein